MLAWEIFRLSSEKQDGIVEGEKVGEDCSYRRDDE